MYCYNFISEMKVNQRNVPVTTPQIVYLAMKANAAALFWFLVWAILPLLKRKKYDRQLILET